MRSLPFFAAIVIVAMLLANSYGQFVGTGLHARLSDMANNDANGGFDTSLIGINAAGINNWGVNQWDLSPIAGITVTQAFLEFTVDRGFTNPNHGSAVDTISIHQIFDSNHKGQTFPSTRNL